MPMNDDFKLKSDNEIPDKIGYFPDERSRVLTLYLVFFGSILLLFVPSIYGALIGLFVCLMTLVGIHSVRSNAEEDSLTQNHMTFLIRTFWRTNLFLLYSAIVSSVYLVLFAEYKNIGNCMVTLPDLFVDAVNYMNFNNFNKAINYCGVKFEKDNSLHVIITLSIALGPSAFYLIWRYLRGWSFASKNKRIPESGL